MALKIIHVMEFQILFAQIFFILATFANQLRRKGSLLGCCSNIWLEIMCA